MTAANNKARTILVTGATGQQGGAVCRQLRQKGFSLRALTRNPEKPAARALEGHGAEVLRGDLSDTAAVERALEDAFGVFSVQTFDGGFDQEVAEGTKLADAANRQTVSHFVYSSVSGANESTGIPHFESKWRIEEHIRRIGMRYTILRPVFFMENWLMMREGIENGVVALPLSPQTRLQMVAVDDIGAFVALALEHPTKWARREFDLAGDELSMTEIAQALGRVSGREVRYQQVPWEAFEQQMGHEMTVMYRWFEQRGYHVDLAEVKREFPPVTVFNQWLEAKWIGAAAQTAASV